MAPRKIAITPFVIALACALSAGLTPGYAQQLASKRIPTAAIISADENVITSLFETKVLASDQAKWLERNEIKRLLEEQKLDAAFGVAGGKDRLSLGKLLKADILVMVRTVLSPEKKDEKLLECVVCETEQGLRLRVTQVPVGKDAEETAGTLAAAFEAALQKYGQTIREIVAVSPLVSDDLSFKYNYLQTAYAKLIEQKLLDQQGVVVVELGEAQAIGRELALAPGEQGIARRSQPLFVLGKFRHSEEKGKTTVALELRLLRGDKQIAAVREPALASSKATAWLQSSTADLLRAVKVAPASPAKPDAAAEAQQLAARANEFFRIGNWEEALALMEASLLLQPDQQELHRDAVVACRHLFAKYWHYEPATRQQIEPSAQYYLRGLDHIESFFRKAEHRSKYRDEYNSDFVNLFSGALKVHPATPPEALALTEEVNASRHAMYTRLARARAKAGFDDERWMMLAASSLPEKEQFAFTAQMIDEFRDLPDARKRTFDAVLSHSAKRETPEFLALVEKLAASPSAAVRQGAAEARQDLAEGEIKWKKLFGKKAVFAGKRIEEVKLTPVEFTLTGFRANQRGPFLPDGCLPAGPGIDVLWSLRALHVMKERGAVKTIWQTDNLNSRFSPVFDGRYIWTPVNAGGRSANGKGLGVFTRRRVAAGLHQGAQRHGAARPYQAGGDCSRSRSDCRLHGTRMACVGLI